MPPSAPTLCPPCGKSNVLEPHSGHGEAQSSPPRFSFTPRGNIPLASASPKGRYVGCLNIFDTSRDHQRNAHGSFASKMCSNRPQRRGVRVRRLKHPWVFFLTHSVSANAVSVCSVVASPTSHFAPRTPHFFRVL